MPSGFRVNVTVLPSSCVAAVPAASPPSSSSPPQPAATRARLATSMARSSQRVLILIECALPSFALSARVSTTMSHPLVSEFTDRKLHVRWTTHVLNRVPSRDHIVVCRVLVAVAALFGAALIGSPAARAHVNVSPTLLESGEVMTL